MSEIITFDSTKRLDTNEIRRRFVQGENLADKVIIRGPRQVGRLDLADLKIVLRADNEEYSASVEQELTPQVEGEKIALTWEVDERFTACSGFADLTLIGYSGIDEVIKITSGGVFVQKNGPAGGVPDVDTWEAVLRELREGVGMAQGGAAEAKASETAAAGSAKTAGEKATAAAASATAAKASETAAAASAKTATDKATAASASADAAKTSEDNAAASKTAAANSAAAAKTSETNAGASKTAAANSAAAAKASETNAAGSKTAAANSASAAKTSETNAASSKTAAANSAAAAKTSETNAKAAADRAEDAANRAGGVNTVNGTAPDANGNVDVEALPPGGTTGQALLKASNQDGDAEWADVDALPKGGATGNVLTKRSNADGDAAWLPADPGGGAAITNYDQIYPVGCYIYSSDTGFDPNTAYGGTWELVAAGVTLRQAGTGHAVGTQYGEAAHTLTAAEMPAHAHHVNVSADRAGTKPCGYAEYVTNGSDNAYYTDAAGGGKAHNNVGPSLAVNIWHKTASEGGKVITAMTGDQLREYMHMRKYTAALPEAGWTQEADGSYTQTVACAGMTADVQVWDVRGQPGATAADNLAIAEALGCITMAESLAGQVKVICGASRPAVDFTAVFKEE